MEGPRDVLRSVAAPARGSVPKGWSRNRKLAILAIVVVFAAGITGAFVVFNPRPVPTAPSSLPIPAGTVFSLEVERAANGTPVRSNGSLVYARTFNGSANGTVWVPGGQCILLEGAWSATAPTLALGASGTGMNGTLGEVFTGSSFRGGAIAFTSFQPDTITVTATIQYVGTPCP